jgi:hypothetical protein
MQRQTLITAVLSVVVTINAYGVILYLEVPEDVTAEMVRNPSVEDAVVIEDFLSI